MNIYISEFEIENLPGTKLEKILAYVLTHGARISLEIFPSVFAFVAFVVWFFVMFCLLFYFVLFLSL